MRKATKADKKLVVEIIAESFYTNPSVNMVVKQDAKKEKRIRKLAVYAFKTALSRNGVLISSDNTGVSICYRYNAKKDSLRDFWNQGVLAIRAISIGKVTQVLKREAYVKSKRPSSGDFMYFWFFGVSDEGKGKGAAYELKEAIFNEAKKQNLAIYLETSVEQNMRVYQRYGFEVYHTWENKEENITIWFMRRI